MDRASWAFSHGDDYKGASEKFLGCGFKGLGFRVEGLGFRAADWQSLGSKGLRVEGLRV